jgi:hypothetical protein
MQMIEARLKKVEREREKLTRQLEGSRRKQFSALPAKYGLKNMDEFISALLPYASNAFAEKLGRKSQPAPAPKQPSTNGAHSGNGASSGNGAGSDSRRRYSPAQQSAVKAALEKGDKTVAEISQELEVSPFTIVAWKKRWGLVKTRKAPASRKKS